MPLFAELEKTKFPRETAVGSNFYFTVAKHVPIAILDDSLRHKKATKYPDESSYNRALLETCIQEKIEVIAVTDHYRFGESKQLIEDAVAAGLIVFPGFEAVSKDGVHFLCLFNPGTSIANIERKIGDCGIHDSSQISPVGKYDAGELLEHCKEWGAVCLCRRRRKTEPFWPVLDGASDPLRAPAGKDAVGTLY